MAAPTAVESTLAVTPVSTHRRRAILIGNPNTGKTTLFNRLCGARAKTSNFPGTTTALRTGALKLERASVEVLDLPGLYDLTLDIPEARIVRDVMQEALKHDDLIVVVVDAGNLSRNLVLVGQLASAHARFVICLNMTDVAERHGVIVDLQKLTNRLGVAVVPMVASRGNGVAELRALIDVALARERKVVSLNPPGVPPPDAPYSAVSAWARDVAGSVARSVPDASGKGREFTERLDRFLTHPVFGFAVFVAVMGGLFWALFALAAVPMDLIDTTFAALSAVAHQYLPGGAIRDLLTDGVIGGIAGTVVFLPQIAFLFFLISLLEDTGYLARAAFVMDRFLHRFGLPGHAFVPLLTAHACALPRIQ
jgi:ferrous iron transport protein B